MAVEYDISSDVAVIKETGSVSQCARVTQMYSGQITYDDEAGSKFATATINGKSQRVMLCIAVNGTVTYDDVPSLYSTVDGHRCLNIVTPTETGTPDDVPSLYETVVIDGQNVRAVRCIMINKTPVYDGVSSTCTFTGDDGKTHTAQLVNKVTGGSVQVIIKGTSPLVLPDAVNSPISLLKAFGGTKQGVPEGYTRVEYLEADGNQSIPLNITGINKRVEIDAQYTGTNTTSLRQLATYDSNYNGTFFGVYSNKWAVAVSNSIGNATVRTLVKCAFAFNSSGYNTATITDGDDTAVYTRSNTRSNKTLTLFGIGSYKFIGKIYGCQIYDNNTNELLFDGIPAVRKSDSVAGLYDSVSGAFLEATGDEPFSVGANVIPTPTAPIDIVCNNGAIKVKDSELPVGYRRVLGYACDNDVLWQITDFHLRGSDTVRISFSINAPCNVFGCYQGTSADDNYDLYASTASGAKYLRYGGGTYLSYFSSADLGQRFDVVFSPTGTTGMPQDSTWAPQTFESANDFLVGSTSLTGSSSKLKGNLYGNIIVDGRLKLIPCERVSDGVLGYFDTYSQTFYEPQGTATSLGYDGSYIAEVYVDGTTETISVSGQNLIDLTACVDGYYYSSTGVYTPSNGMKMTDFIPVKANTSYTVYFAQGLSSVNVRINIFDSGKVWQSQSTMSISGSTPEDVLVITPDIDGYMSVSCLASGTSYGDWNTAQVVKGSYTVETMPEYAPYNHSGTATAEMLLSVDGNTDEQEILSGAITRKVGIRILTGEESWGILSSANGSYFYNAPVVAKLPNTCICSHYKTVSSSVSAATTPDKTIKYGETSFSRRIYIKDKTFNSVTKWKQFLADQYAAGTPVFVLFPLATPTTESVAGQSLQVTKGDNTVEITQASIGGLELEAEYKAAVELTIQEAEDANLDNNVTVTIQ